MTRMARGTMVAGLLCAGAASVGIGVAAGLPDAPPPGPDRLDRGLAVEKLQSFSDYVGFEAHFSLGEPDTTLVMVGGQLCGDDVLAVLPGDMAALARGAGFTRLECRGARGELAVVAVPR